MHGSGWRGRLLLTLLVVWAFPRPVLACGSSCECPPGQKCVVDGGCEPAGDVSGPGIHPLCCTDPGCFDDTLVCEHPDGSVGSCGGVGCVPTSCSNQGKTCGQTDDGCNNLLYCGACPEGESCFAGNCQGPQCTPSCGGNVCGDDGCGGSCGDCPPGEACAAGGLCFPCTANCFGKQCGDDGCNGSCGQCESGQVCTPGGICGDCSPSCAGKECGDNGCGGSCGVCGFGVWCNPMGVCICQPECLNKECGDDGCGGLCGSCGSGFECSPGGICVPESGPQVEPEGVDVMAEVAARQPLEEVVASEDPIVDLTPEEIAADSIGGPAESCPPGTHLAYGKCAKDPAQEDSAGSGTGGCALPPLSNRTGGAPLMLFLATVVLLAGLRHRWNLLVCLGACCALMLVPACSETQLVGNGSDQVAGDIPGGSGGPDEDGGSRRRNVCTPDCEGKECGKDGCGGLCGSCLEGVDCVDYQCTGECMHDCAPKGSSECTGDAAWRECGEFDADGCLDWSDERPCPGAGSCENGKCQCEPDCTGKTCGYDGCVGSCGTCKPGFTCSDFQCVEGCVDECTVAGETLCSGTGYTECGHFDDDECLEWSGVSACPGTGQCVGGACQCTPSCVQKGCGDDGCGGSCGECPPGLVCKNYQCVEGIPNECNPGEKEEVDCGLCGTQSRSCNAEGIWSSWSECVGEGMCAPGDLQAQECGLCGEKNRVCNASCKWDAWGDCDDSGVCTPGESMSQSCGLCGSQSRTCSDACQWGEWAGCNGQGSCTPGETQAQPCGVCGTQTRVCNNFCQWGSWSGCLGGGVCQQGEMQSQPCGNCGSQTRTCDGNCQWTSWGTCVNQGSCSPGQWQTCGGCGNQECGGNCQWGQCMGQGECSSGAISTEGCPACRAKGCTAQCIWAPSCTECAACQTFTKCGTSCPSGFHATGYSCNFSCGSSCYYDNQATCAPSCGNSFTKCGTSCPSGYHSTGYGCNFSCGSSCYYDNQVTCVAD